jgi:cytochrome c oxidase subunit 1
MGISTLPFLYNVIWSFWNGHKAGDNPWNALTPEWLTSSPPPVENWRGEAPLVTHPYGSGQASSTLPVELATGKDLWKGS